MRTNLNTRPISESILDMVAIHYINQWHMQNFTDSGDMHMCLYHSKGGFLLEVANMKLGPGKRSTSTFLEGKQYYTFKLFDRDIRAAIRRIDNSIEQAGWYQKKK